jgi:hypothetical protein
MCVGARTCAHVCVRTFLDLLAPTLVKTSLSVGYMHFTSALACAHYARACTARILYIYARSHILGQTLSKLLRVTESCMGYLIFTCALACVHYAHACTHMRACVHSHIFGCIRSKFGGDIPLHGLHNFYTCVFTLYAQYARTISMPVLHACARSHIFGRIFSKLHRDMHGLLDFVMHHCVSSAYVHFGTDSLQTW